MKQTKEKKKETKKPSFMLRGVIMIIAIVMILVATHTLSSSINLEPTHTYICDNHTEDKCLFAQIKDGGVWLKGCEKNNEYFCQSVIEVD